jgi:L-rhamnonate dehydratase
MASKAREVIGPNALLLADCYMSWPAEVVLEMARRLAPYNVYWFEDTCTPDHLDNLAALRPQIKPILLAGGEHDFSHHTFERLAHAGALDLWQPDITWCGGITAGLRILDIARAHNISVVPHRGGETWGLHLIMATDCADLAEAHSDQWIPKSEGLWIGMPEVVDGYLQPGGSPGFGVVVNEGMV